MAKEFTADDDALLAELGVEAEAKKPVRYTARQERIIAGFEDIQRFVDEHGRLPAHGEGKDIFERLYAVRLDRMRELDECRTLIEPLDRQGLLKETLSGSVAPELLDDAALLAALGVEQQAKGLTDLKYVRAHADKQAAEEIATRQPCSDFAKFKPLFSEIQQELDNGIRQTRPFKLRAEIMPGRFFVLGGQKVYVASMGEVIKTDHGNDARLRVIFDNGTESNMLMRSLQRALNKDEFGRRISDPVAGPLFAAVADDGDEASGTIYVLRSLSSHPVVAKNREIIHKIGVTSGPLAQRFAKAKDDPTFLMDDVEVVATYQLYNINRTKLENIVHRVLADVRLEIEIQDRFGKPVRPQEWFLVPLPVIDEIIELLQAEKLQNFRYDRASASLIEINEQ